MTTERLTKQKDKVTSAIIKAFKERYNEEPGEFETIWPLSCWDYIQTETRSFNVKLKMSTGKLEYFEEEK